MKITSFDPLILTKDAEGTIALFEALGFEKVHKKDDLEGREDIVGVRMENEGGFHVDVVHSDRIDSTKPDLLTIRMNVDNFDEAREMLESHGLKSETGEMVTDASSKSMGMRAPSGFRISLVEHIKKGE
ncbi:MAG: hypothetical protein IJ088_09600 [Clostridia bacterium]|nr:hypothetical protein [Clostridia bacterium]